MDAYQHPRSRDGAAQHVSNLPKGPSRGPGDSRVIDYLKRVVESGTKESSHRFALVVATLTFAVSVLGLTVAAICGKDVADALWPVSLGLAGAAGYAFATGKAKEAA